MSKDKQIGSTLLRLLADEVSMADVRRVLTALRDNPSLRERCSSIGTFVEAEDEKRQECCKHMVDALIGWIEPRTLDETVIPKKSNYPCQGTKALMVDALQSLPKYSPWYKHIRRQGAKIYTNKQGRCFISKEMYFILGALEDLWGVQGQYTHESEDFMKNELAIRGSKMVGK